MFPLSPFLRPTLIPTAQVIDIKESTSAATTYTFSGCNLPVGRKSVGLAYIDTAPLHASSHRAVWVMVHAEDATTNFNVNSVTLGGTALIEEIESSTFTYPVMTAIYYNWVPDSYTDNDVVVTFSEAITGCAIGIIEVSSVNSTINGGNVSNNGSSGAYSLTSTVADSEYGNFRYYLMGSTNENSGAECMFSIESLTTQYNSCMHPLNLYSRSNANFSYAAAFAYSPSSTLDASEERFRVIWTAGNSVGAIAGYG